MKKQILVSGCALALAVSAWCVKISMESGAEKAVASTHTKTARNTLEGKAPGRMTSFHNESSEDTRMSSSAISGSADSPRQTLSSSQPTLSQKPVANPAGLYEPGVSPAASTGSRPSPARSVYTSTTPQPAAASSSGYSTDSNADPGVLEVDPGVPVPAAALPPPQGNQSPAAAAAQQHIADFFVQDVNAAINQPGTTDAAASQAYYNALTKANDQYRALYGDAAYNQAGIKAAKEAQAAK